VGDFWAGDGMIEARLRGATVAEGRVRRCWEGTHMLYVRPAMGIEVGGRCDPWRCGIVGDGVGLGTALGGCWQEGEAPAMGEAVVLCEWLARSPL
jgi:hypothetical protein